ncbi:MAG: hypothetical protein KDE03_02165 [Rhodobacteraceae bacterium]|nr:hypothetical protein [Paracoccaceae bacterium]
MRIFVAFTALALLAACQPPVPDSRVGGVGFDNYSDYLARREAALAGQTRTAAAPSAQPIVPPVAAAPAAGMTATGAPTSADLAGAGITGGGNLPAQVRPAPTALPAQPQQPAAAALPAQQAPLPNNAGISDEQDFSAVSGRETIQSDKERIAANKSQYQQVAPSALPERDASSAGAVNLVEYALNAPNRLGEAIYPRSKILLSNWQKNCARYATPEDAQQAFLKAGGPARDGKNLDPDGDGFACYWDPTPFQKVRG